MKNVTMISRRSFLKAAMAASAVSALALTGCGGSASSTTASSAAASAAAEGGQTFKVGIVNYVDHASLNQIVASVESRLDELGKEKGVTFDYADYYANAQADQSNLNQIGADLVGDGVDVIVAVATPTAATMLAAVEDTSALTEAELLKIQTIRRELGTQFCRRCNYCQPCTAGISISGIFVLEGYLNRYGLGDWARQRYAAMGQKAGDCVGCGACEKRCPYQLPIRQMLARCKTEFGA